MTILCYPRCSTCHKALAWLAEHGLEAEYRDIQKQNPTAEELAAWAKRAGLPLRRLFNTSGQLYRQHGLAAKLPGMPEAEMLTWLASDGMLVKRPLLLSENGVLVGFKPEAWAEALL